MKSNSAINLVKYHRKNGEAFAKDVGYCLVKDALFGMVEMQSEYRMPCTRRLECTDDKGIAEKESLATSTTPIK